MLNLPTYVPLPSAAGEDGSQLTSGQQHQQQPMAPHPALLGLLALRSRSCRFMQLSSAAIADHRGALEASRCWARVGHAWEALGNGPSSSSSLSSTGQMVMYPPALAEAKAAFVSSIACVEGMGGLLAVSRVLLGQELVSAA